jgi:HEPN domain-containing protein
MPGTDSANPLDWYAKAKRQFDAALLLREELPDLCLTHVQQTAEILLKGKLLEKGFTAGPTHSVIALQKKLKDMGTSFTEVTDPGILDHSYLFARYPTPGYVLPPPEKLDAVIAEVRRLGEQLCPAYFPPIQAAQSVTPSGLLSEEAQKELHEGMSKASDIHKKASLGDEKRSGDLPKK